MVKRSSQRPLLLIKLGPLVVEALTVTHPSDALRLEDLTIDAGLASVLTSSIRKLNRKLGSELQRGFRKC